MINNISEAFLVFKEENSQLISLHRISYALKALGIEINSKDIKMIIKYFILNNNNKKYEKI